MTVLHLANLLAVVTSIWAFWVRRHSLGSRWDAPMTVGVGLYGVASVLDSSWPASATLSFPLTGKYYLMAVLGHIAYLAGTAAGLKSVYIRLVSDDDIWPLMRTRIAPAVVVASTVMMICFLASPTTSTMPADYLYLVPMNGWMSVYFATFLLTLTGLLWAALFGAVRLREEPNSGAVPPLMGTASTGSMGCLTLLAAILTGHGSLIPTVAWPALFTVTTVASLVCAHSWRRRAAELRQTDTEG